MSAQEDPAAEKGHDIEVQAQQPAEPLLPPLEGKRAWLMATGGFLGLFATFVSHSSLSLCSVADFYAGIHEWCACSESPDGVSSRAEISLPLQVSARIKATIFNGSTRTRRPSRL